MPSLFFMTAPPPARKRKNGNLTVPVLLFPGRRRPPYSLLHQTPATSAPIRSPAAQKGFSPACTRGTSPASAAPSSGLSEKPLRFECPGGSFGQAHRPGTQTAAVQTCKTCRPHKPAQTRTNPHKPAQTRTNRAIQNPHAPVQAAKAACVRPHRTRLRMPGETATQRPRRDGPGYSCSGSATRMRPQYSQMMIFLPWRMSA